ncbi:MAG TPA: single-stranded-DNA-specific exonuclease RecJ [Chloroflexi bacterium]|nr:single-stranded-DNA-specific exonuclease RecJ [Chloroflexota bacterium]
MPTFQLSPPPTVPEDLRRAVGGHPLVAELLYRRGITTPEAARAFLDPSAYRPASPLDLPDMARAVALLQEALGAQKRILVWGDFDVDGQTSTALLVGLLRGLGGRVNFYIPVRARESHGVHLSRLESLLEDPGFDLLLTCDTGVTAHAAVEAMRAAGRTVIVTDHHELGERLPAADAVVNPRRLPPEHPLATLPGVGVAYELALALLDAAPAPGISPDDFLDLTALGIVADVALQRGEARYLLQRGLQSLRRTRRAGLRALANAAGLSLEGLTEEQIGFGLGPRLNALGRLDDANAAVELLTTADETRATALALRLEALNARRRFLTDQVYRAARAQLERNPALAQYPVIVLGQEGWPGGVVGIVANRLVEDYGRPVILFSLGEDGLARGSARSVEGIHITEAIAAQKDLLLSFGGHPMAAGCALKTEDLPAFREGLARSLKGRIPPEGVQAALKVDAELPLEALSLELAADLERLAPFGAGNPQPLFLGRGLQIREVRPIGREGAHRRVRVRTPAGTEHGILWWRSADIPLPEGRFDLAYTVRTSTYRGQEQLQITWQAAFPTEARPAEVAPARPQRQVVDARHVEEAAAARWLSRPGTVVWAEGGLLPQGRGRHELEPAKTLVVWSAPPSEAILQRTLERVQPQTVVLVARDPRLDEPQVFLRRLAGMVKYALQTYEGRIVLEKAAAALAQRLDTLLAGLAWLAAEGHITLLEGDEETYRVGTGSGKRQPQEAAALAGRIRSLLEETAEYRRYVRQADLSGWLAG